MKLPPFRPVAGKILLVDPEAGDAVKQLVRLIRTDAAFSSEILHFANSAWFGFTAEIDSVEHAVTLMGVNRLKTTAMRVAMQSFLGTGLQDALLRRCWLHSLASAEIAEKLAGLGTITKERVYMAALLHDLGRLALLKACAKDYRTVMAEPCDNIEQSIRLERQVFRLDHCSVGAALMRIWNFPDYFSMVNQQHHDCTAIDDDMLGVVRMSCRLATCLGYGSLEFPQNPAYQELAATFPEPVRTHLIQTEEQFCRSIDARIRQQSE